MGNAALPEHQLSEVFVGRHEDSLFTIGSLKDLLVGGSRTLFPNRYDMMSFRAKAAENLLVHAFIT